MNNRGQGAAYVRYSYAQQMPQAGTVTVGIYSVSWNAGDWVVWENGVVSVYSDTDFQGIYTKVQ